MESDPNDKPEKLLDSQKYLIRNPCSEEEVQRIIGDVSEEYGLGSVSFALSQDFPFDLDTRPELSQTVLAALRERGMKIKRYEY